MNKYIKIRNGKEHYRNKRTRRGERIRSDKRPPGHKHVASLGKNNK